MKKFLSATLGLLFTATTAHAGQRWRLADDGAIEWPVEQGDTHTDHIEMAGKNVAAVLRYGVDPSGRFTLNKSLIWPMLRTIPNNTHASLMRRYTWNALDGVTINGRSENNETVDEIILDGTLTVKSRHSFYSPWEMERTFFPSVDNPSLIEIYTITNTGDSNLEVDINELKETIKTSPQKGVTGSYIIEAAIDTAGVFNISPGKSLTFSAHISAVREGENQPVINGSSELARRRAFVELMHNSLVLETPDPVLDRMMAFSKVRANESIYDTHGGPMHGPGGESYYAAIWANDQAEYINPYFPYIGYDYGNASALNSFRHFARFMNDEMRPIPSSIIAEGDDIWNGAGDRGDAAMIAYGAARYALARGSKEEAEELWPLITWCLDYCRHNLNEDGVVKSNTDELEGRFPAGEANLCTSTLYYDALISASYLAPEIGKGNGKKYLKEARELRKNIDRYFSGNIEGFDTYAYYKGNDRLRAWICIPLTAGIDEKAGPTLDALFSSKLWTENGLLTESTDKTFWDRSTLYALRGAYTVGATEQATDFLRRYSAKRLLGAHVPYAIEAWPEGGQRHLSAESGLYGRIITEGLFGIRPTGLKSFTLTPRLPHDWDHMNLRHIKAFNSDFDIEVKRASDNRLEIAVINGDKTRNYTIREGKTINITL